MQHIEAGARSISLLVDLNVDRIIYFATILAALMVGAYIGTF
ncbi:hypothetical protein [Oceaniglobus ichthyenteri]|nr:hypothetical protein [Oceaniglobus ichthyenteri]